jgi:hypothetical protein
MFREGEYIVTLKVDGTNHNCARTDFCFKQRLDSSYLRPVVDLQGDIDNGHSAMSYDRQKWLIDWRYATDYEIEVYESLFKPYDTSKINQKTENYKIY